jgi:hypothetical protein
MPRLEDLIVQVLSERADEQPYVPNFRPPPRTRSWYFLKSPILAALAVGLLVAIVIVGPGFVFSHNGPKRSSSAPPAGKGSGPALSVIAGRQLLVVSATGTKTVTSLPSGEALQGPVRATPGLIALMGNTTTATGTLWLVRPGSRPPVELAHGVGSFAVAGNEIMYAIPGDTTTVLHAATIAVTQARSQLIERCSQTLAGRITFSRAFAGGAAASGGVNDTTGGAFIVSDSCVVRPIPRILTVANLSPDGQWMVATPAVGGDACDSLLYGGRVIARCALDLQLSAFSRDGSRLFSTGTTPTGEATAALRLLGKSGEVASKRSYRLPVEDVTSLSVIDDDHVALAIVNQTAAEVQLCSLGMSLNCRTLFSEHASQARTEGLSVASFG